MGFYGVRVEDGRELLGSDNQAIDNKSKTESPIIRRIQKGVFPKGIWRIYRFSNFYDEDTFKLIKTIRKN
jgi:hypothetical protein